MESNELQISVDNKHTIWMEKYRPTSVESLAIPESIKNKFRKYVQDEDIPNIGLWSNSPGCLLPGTSIDVQTEQIFLTKKEICKKYDITNKKDYSFLRSKALGKLSDNKQTYYIDINSISIPVLKLTKSSYKYKQFLKTDSTFNNKFLKYEHWLYTLSPKLAFKRVSYLRKYKEYFEITPYKFKSNKKWKLYKNYETVLKRQLQILYSKDITIPKNSSNIDFWLWRGYTIDETSKDFKKNKLNKKYFKTFKTNVNYWINKGYSETVAKLKIFEQDKRALNDI